MAIVNNLALREQPNGGKVDRHIASNMNINNDYGDVKAVTLADANLPDGPCIGIVVGTAGTLNYMDMSGDIISAFPVLAGRNHLSARQLRTGGTAANIWALY